MTDEDNRSFADQFDVAWKAILAQALGPYLVLPASDEDDRREDTDCRNYHFRGCEVRVRTRRSRWCKEPFTNQFTLNPVELEKVLTGEIDVLGVGFAETDKGSTLQLHWVLSVKFILACWDQFPETRDPVEELPGFSVFDLQKFPGPRIVIATNVQQWEKEQRQKREFANEEKRRARANAPRLPSLEPYGETRRRIEDARDRGNHKKTAI